MKKEKKTEKKLSLKKLQMAKITNGMISIKGGGASGTYTSTTAQNKTLNQIETIEPSVSLGFVQAN